ARHQVRLAVVLVGAFQFVLRRRRRFRRRRLFRGGFVLVLARPGDGAGAVGAFPLAPAFQAGKPDQFAPVGAGEEALPAPGGGRRLAFGPHRRGAVLEQQQLVGRGRGGGGGFRGGGLARGRRHLTHDAALRAAQLVARVALRDLQGLAATVTEKTHGGFRL